MRGDGDFITVEDIAQMKYMAKVVEETIRMANISLAVFRVAIRDVEYEDLQYQRDIMSSSCGCDMHRHARNFENLVSLIPERWDKSAKPGMLQVFGGGSRICPGNMLARLEITILLYHLVLGYEWEVINPDAKIKYLPHPMPVDGAAMGTSLKQSRW